ncbi:fimbrial protein [Xenorhabdus sp. KK7.4]|uniref:fimbrial protein n=1 Tax=Xenorhabdus sp. KK7.4 TaxID=1851572 RepID=UPI000C06229F|nr:fimbrial protein [Xenorhabdus sp. KK7.4]PHM53931.1 fimbrial adhesin protein precursor [Xenorhabdus sp. KK7.4]
MVKGLKLLVASIFIVGTMSSFASQANYRGYDCGYYNFTPGETQVSFGSSIVLPKDYPMGTVIKEITLEQIYNTGYVAYCNGLVSTSWGTPSFRRIHYNYDAIYDSGVPGIGIRINNWPNEPYGHDWLPRTSNNPTTCSPPYGESRGYTYYCGRTWGYLTVQLVKIAPNTGTGRIGGGVLTSAILGNNWLIHTFYLDNTEIITPTPSCSLTHKTTLVNMGKVRTSEFRGINSTTQKKDFHLELDCDTNARTNMKLDGRPASNGSYNIWALDRDSSNATARGVGLQILFLNKLISMGETIVIQPSNEVRHFSLPMQARYIQTEPRVTPGKANATATITLTYQ